jgi:hypothetical protein
MHSSFHEGEWNVKIVGFRVYASVEGKGFFGFTLLASVRAV